MTSMVPPQDYINHYDMMNTIPKQYPYYYDQRMKPVMDPQAQYTMDLIGIASDQQQQDIKQEYCRDFQRGKCMRGNKCKYRHADNVDLNPRETTNGKFTFCRNFQRGKCNLPNCKYLHLSRADEEFYFQTGTLPSHDVNYNFLHSFPGQTTTSEPSSTTLASLAAKPFQVTTTSLPPVGTTQSTPLDNLSSIPISNEQPLQDPFYKQSPPKPDSPFSPPSESPVSEKSKTPPQKSLSHSTQSISEYLGGNTTRSRRWSIDNTDQTDEKSHNSSPFLLTSRDEAFKNPEIDLMKIKLHQMEEKVKSLEFYNDILREQNMQLKQQVKRYENPFSPIYKPIIQEDSEGSNNN